LLRLSSACFIATHADEPPSFFGAAIATPTDVCIRFFLEAFLQLGRRPEIDHIHSALAPTSVKKRLHTSGIRCQLRMVLRFRRSWVGYLLLLGHSDEEILAGPRLGKEVPCGSTMTAPARIPSRSKAANERFLNSSPPVMVQQTYTVSSTISGYTTVSFQGFHQFLNAQKGCPIAYGIGRRFAGPISAVRCPLLEQIRTMKGCPTPNPPTKDLESFSFTLGMSVRESPCSPPSWSAYTLTSWRIEIIANWHCQNRPPGPGSHHLLHSKNSDSAPLDEPPTYGSLMIISSAARRRTKSQLASVSILSKRSDAFTNPVSPPP